MLVCLLVGFKCYSCEEDPNEGRGNCLIGEAHLEDMVECSEEGKLFKCKLIMMVITGFLFRMNFLNSCRCPSTTCPVLSLLQCDIQIQKLPEFLWSTLRVFVDISHKPENFWMR